MPLLFTYLVYKMLLLLAKARAAHRRVPLQSTPQYKLKISLVNRRCCAPHSAAAPRSARKQSCTPALVHVKSAPC